MIGVSAPSTTTLLTFLCVNLSFVLSLGRRERVYHERMCGGCRVLVLLIVIVVVSSHQA
jgi:hypothetical protein